MNLPQNEHILLHVRITNIYQNINLVKNYWEACSLVLDWVHSFNPKSIVVPSFTYSFTKNSCFSINNTSSEVGRFSEEVRLNTSTKLRTNDPIFSVIDVDNYGWTDEAWNKEAFGCDSLWEKWDQENGVIVNIDLPKIVSTQLHYIEKISGVSYRFDKIFTGDVCNANGHISNINYKYFVRNLNSDFEWDRSKILHILNDKNINHSGVWNGLDIRWFRANDMRRALEPMMIDDHDQLMKKKHDA